ncbi:sialate O-acetylesterase [Haloferula helveola]|uniref:Sialate O-acetylesterase n=1 Tax=Haloferula helveola TaxID=490095 RepID=A0ABM7R7X2_9BACT|nr:sialate O-acetylesterase [Haloferula helveola]
MKPTILLSLLLALPVLGKPVKVFILAGQSNMEGKVQRKLIDHQATDPKTADLFKQLRKDDGWAVRDDVFIDYLGRHGGLTVGYGSGDRTGVELELGTVLGEYFDEPVLLIKTAWGGRSIQKPFRPPSAGLPDTAKLEEELKNAQEKVRKNNEKRKREDPLPTMEDIKKGYGADYRNMLENIQRVLDEKDSLFPELKGHEPELAGFVWFQGWNDQYGGAELEYESNMKHFILDVRKDLKSPELPFVIGVMGQNGSKEPKGAMLTIQEAQLAMEKVSEFKGNVKAVRTDVLVDKAAEALYPTWKDNFEEWEKTGSDHGYHYLGSAIWHVRMGKAFAEALLEMQP